MVQLCTGVDVELCSCEAVKLCICGAVGLCRYDCAMYSCADINVRVCSVKLYRCKLCSYFVVRACTC